MTGGTAMEWTSTTTGLIVLPPGGRLDRHRVGVPAGTAPGVGVLVAGTAEVAVHLDPLSEVPAGHIALGGEAAARLGLGDRLAAPWSLRTASSVQPLERLELEVQVESQLDDVVAQLNDTRDLAARLLWLPDGVNVESLWLTVDVIPFRVRDVSPAPFYGPVMRVTTATAVTVFAPGVKTGVDIIVLADCSGSMSATDMTDTTDARRGQPMERSEALRRALGRLLDVRLEAAGRVSRMAVVRFTDKCGDADIRFPRGGGMAEIDGRSPAEVKQQFRDAITLLRSESAGTHIGTALNFAAELLHRHGHPGNDRLIVLLSDGGSQPKGVDATGEEVGGLEDEVSLMDHLHRSMNVRLHAIGISTEKQYLDYRARARDTSPLSPAFVPNHQLLARLMAVGGGDPAQMGDTDVLEKYFKGLGGGVSRQVRQPHPAAADRETLSGELPAQYSTVNKLASHLAGSLLFDARDGLSILVSEAKHPVSTFRDFKSVVSELYKISFDTGVICSAVVADLRDLHKWQSGNRRTPQPAGDYPIPAVVEWTASDHVQQFRKLRHWANHNADELSPADKRVIGEFLMAAVGTVTPAEDDPAVWVKLHLAVLTRFRDILTRYIEVFRAHEARMASKLTGPSQPAPSRPAAPVVMN